MSEERQTAFYVRIDNGTTVHSVLERSPLDYPTTMRNLSVGETFVYGGHTYTKVEKS